MPQKGTDAAVAEATKDANFLATCFMNMTSKPLVHAPAVAEKLSMSVGGVRNKLRPIMKAMEDAGVLWTTNQPATPNRGGSEKTSSKKAEIGAKDDVFTKEGDAAEPGTPTPKAKARAKQPAKATNSSTKRGRKAKSSDVDGEGSSKENAMRKKKAKVAPATVTEEQEEVKKQIKNESEEAAVENGDLENVAEVDGIAQDVKGETENE